jgi:D-glycero-D-manno-heptose 1,7-bisphosphate phosphatase
VTAVFLDRDGVIIKKAPEGEYIADCSQVEYLPGALESVRDLCEAGFRIFIVTNQRGLALHKIRLQDFDEINNRMKLTFAAHGAAITDIYFCPHDISESCVCRKPKPGMLLRAAEEYGLILQYCWMIGDSLSDVEAGNNAGCKTILITDSARTLVVKSNFLASDLKSAVRQILDSQ